MEFSDIECAIRIEKATIKEESQICIDGQWYYIVYFCDNSDRAEICLKCENNKATIENIPTMNSNDAHYNKIVKYDNEIYLIRTKL